MMRNTIPFLFIAAGALVLNSCKPDLDIPTPSAGNADVSRFVVVGDDYMAGYQDGALYKKGQLLSIGALIARQFPSPQTLAQPLMPDDNGIGINTSPYNSDYVTKSHLDYRTDCLGETSIAPFKSTFTTISAEGYLEPVSPASSGISNFAVPQLKVKDYFTPSVGSATGNVFYHRFASNPGTSTVYSDLMSANATFFTAWLGMADVYEYARRGAVNASLISSAEFSVYLDSVLHGLTANGAKGVIANIPDLESFPFYTLIPYNGLELETQELADSLNTATGNIFNYQVGENGFAIEDPNAPNGYRKMKDGEYILLNIPSDSLKCGKMGVFYGMPDVFTLDSYEADSIHQIIAAYNSVIAQKASQYNLALVDMNQFFKTVQSGIVWNGADIDAEFISGGFFSLDGYHPNQKGYALIATEFIKAINNKFGASLPYVYCSECDGIRFP